MKSTRKILIYLIIIAIIDTILPLPIMALTLIYVVVERPAWFKNLVSQLYS